MQKKIAKVSPMAMGHLMGAILNPDSALYDPDTKQPDWSDAGYCFVVEPLSIEEFRRQWLNAQKRDFTAEDMRRERLGQR